MRDLILDFAALVVQGDIGIAYRTLRGHGWDARLCGRYTGEIPRFASHRQPALGAAYREPDAGEKPPFAFGYEGTRQGSNAMNARLAGN